MLSQKSAEDIINGKDGFTGRRDQILDLPSQLFSPYKMILMTALWREGELDFKQLFEDAPKISQGNLSSHLNSLEKLGIVDILKGYEGKRPKTSYKLTKEGRKKVVEIVTKLNIAFGDISGDMQIAGS